MIYKIRVIKNTCAGVFILVKLQGGATCMGGVLEWVLFLHEKRATMVSVGGVCEVLTCWVAGWRV